MFAGVVALVGIIGLTYALAETGVQSLAKVEVLATLVEFTADGELHPEHTAVVTKLHGNAP